MQNSTPDTGAQIELPKYKSHKTVWALKIKEITDPNNATDGSRMLVPEEPRYAPFGVTGEYMTKHDPQVGGYYVQYADGYQSYSPAKAFEEGYTAV
jgi:hypothetical protein